MENIRFIQLQLFYSFLACHQGVTMGSIASPKGFIEHIDTLVPSTASSKVPYALTSKKTVKYDHKWRCTESGGHLETTRNFRSSEMGPKPFH